MSNFAKAATGVEGYIFDAQTFMWLWKMAILFVAGGLLSYFGGRYFIKKDLPL